MPPPSNPPSSGATMYTAHHPAPFTRNGTLPQPANAENTRGPRSRAGLKLAIVSGPTSEIRSVTVRPIKAAVRICGRALFRSLVAQKITNSSTAVAITPAPKAAVSKHPQPRLSPPHPPTHCRFDFSFQRFNSPP